MDQDQDQQEYDDLPGWRRRLRRRWADAFQRNALLRHLVHEPLFLAAALAALVAGGGIALLFPKIWDPAPAGFSKAIRVSLLDYAQAWSLRRAARRAESEGRWDDALAAWRAALANNLVDPESLRGILTLLGRAPWSRSANLGLVFLTRDTLLEVGRTNRADARLIADVFERHRLPDFALESLRPWASDLRPDEDAVWLRSLLSSGRVQAFAERWDRDRSRHASDPLLALYRAAYDAGWGAVERAPAGLALLRSPREDRATQLVALRLLGAVALQRTDGEEYSRVLEQLERFGSTMVQDHAAWWSLLHRQGRTEEARNLAKAYQPIPPPTPVEAVQLARALLGLGLRPEAIAFFRNHASGYGMSLEVWAAYLDALMLEGSWNEVRRVAADLRASATRRDDLLSVTLYADVRADLAEGRRTAVQEYLRRLRDTEIRDPSLALRIAAGLSGSGEHETAWHLLQKIAQAREDAPEYWFEVIAVAQARRDVEGMQNASRHLLRLAPGNPNTRLIRLVVLLGSRTDPAEALALSLQLAGTGTASPAMAVNRAMALLLNHRAQEALALLGGLAPDRMPADTLNSWRIAMTDALAQLGRHREALETGSRVDASILLPPQESWFRQLLADLRKQTTPEARLP